MIHGIDPSTRQPADYWSAKARTNRRITLTAKTIIAATLIGVILAVIL